MSKSDKILQLKKRIFIIQHLEQHGQATYKELFQANTSGVHLRSTITYLFHHQYIGVRTESIELDGEIIETHPRFFIVNRDDTQSMIDAWQYEIQHYEREYKAS